VKVAASGAARADSRSHLYIVRNIASLAEFATSALDSAATGRPDRRARMRVFEEIGRSSRSGECRSLRQAPPAQSPPGPKIFFAVPAIYARATSRRVLTRNGLIGVSSPTSRPIEALGMTPDDMVQVGVNLLPGALLGTRASSTPIPTGTCLRCRRPAGLPGFSS